MISKSDLLELDVASRLELIEELWDSIASDPIAASQVPLSDEERERLEERLREHRADPGSARSWQETRAEILKQR
jgi:putative addiction module component (TIGR02574 family)